MLVLKEKVEATEVRAEVGAEVPSEVERGTGGVLRSRAGNFVSSID